MAVVCLAVMYVVFAGGNRMSGFDNQEAHQDPKQEYMSLIRDQR